MIDLNTLEGGKGLTADGFFFGRLNRKPALSLSASPSDDSAMDVMTLPKERRGQNGAASRENGGKHSSRKKAAPTGAHGDSALATLLVRDADDYGPANRGNAAPDSYGKQMERGRGRYAYSSLTWSL